MPETSYPYSISQDFPDGRVNTAKLVQEIQRSVITKALSRIDTAGDTVYIIFKDVLTSSDKTTLDGDTTNPAGGLIAAHDNTASAPDAMPVYIKPIPFAERSYAFSINLCDKTTWYAQATRVTAETLGTGDGSTTTFGFSHTNIIDLSHGKVTDEDWIFPSSQQGGSTFVPQVKLNGTLKTEREFAETSGGDYTIDYTNGVVTFFTPPANGVTVSADYFYANGSLHIVAPPAGKKFTLVRVELQMTEDVIIQDAIETAIYVYNPADLPNRIEYTPSHTKLKKLYDWINWSQGSYPPVPALGGATRGFTQAIYQFPLPFPVSIPLSAHIGAELHFWLSHDRPYSGTQCTFTYYGVVEPDS
jgi:hypothetical protein